MSVATLCRWEADGKRVAQHTPGGHRRYDLAKLRPEAFRAAPDAERKTLAHARVSSDDKKGDLEGQSEGGFVSLLDVMTPQQEVRMLSFFAGVARLHRTIGRIGRSLSSRKAMF